MITELHHARNYKNETLHVAVSVVDRFLKALKTNPPDLNLLAVTALLLGAKLT
jgi:hypothetical protein